MGRGVIYAAIAAAKCKVEMTLIVSDAYIVRLG
jgi:hypothetical protein